MHRAATLVTTQATTNQKQATTISRQPKVAGHRHLRQKPTKPTLVVEVETKDQCIVVYP